MHLTVHKLMHPPISNNSIAFVSKNEAVTGGWKHVPHVQTRNTGLASTVFAWAQAQTNACSVWIRKGRRPIGRLDNVMAGP